MTSTLQPVKEAAAGARSDPRAGKYLTFQLAGQEFGIEVLKVREIMGVLDITAAPRMPPHVKGVINLRGKVVPVIDLRLKFGLPAAAYTARTCLVVTQLKSDNGAVLIGIVVDSVAEVLTVLAGEIEDKPGLGERLENRYRLGMAKVKGKVKILLDIERILSAHELRNLNALEEMPRE